MNAYEKLKNHIKLMTESYNIYSQYVTNSGDYLGLSFRPSTYKKDAQLQFIAVNLQTQMTFIIPDKTSNNNNNNVKNDNDNHFIGQNNHFIGQYFHVTFGAPAAHLYRFKNHGLRQLIKLRERLMQQQLISMDQETQIEILDLDIQIQMRLDVCIPQIVSALISGISKMIEFHTNISIFDQLLHCGLLVQFESLLSTHGSEIGMIGDFDVVCKLLEHFHIQFVDDDSKLLNPSIMEISPSPNSLFSQSTSLYEPDSIEINNNNNNLTSSSSSSINNTNNNNNNNVHVIDKKFNLIGEYLISWHVPFFDKLPIGIQQGELIHIKPILFTQGINEKQTVAIRLGETKLQERINQESFSKLYSYYRNWVAFQNFKGITELEDFTNQLNKVFIFYILFFFVCFLFNFLF